jgi:hypothetical protein
MEPRTLNANFETDSILVHEKIFDSLWEIDGMKGPRDVLIATRLCATLKMAFALSERSLLVWWRIPFEGPRPAPDLAVQWW